MALVAQLTFAEIADKISDADTKAYVLALATLPAGVPLPEFILKFLTGAYLAQTAKNAAAAPIVAGEALNLVSAPVYGQPNISTTTGIMGFSTAMTVNFVSTTDTNLTIGSYV